MFRDGVMDEPETVAVWVVLMPVIGTGFLEWD